MSPANSIHVRSHMPTFVVVKMRTFVDIHMRRFTSHIDAHIRSHIEVYILASFELSYVNAENDKIGKSGWWKLGRKSEVWRRKTGFENFLLDENGCFEVDL